MCMLCIIVYVCYCRCYHLWWIKIYAWSLPSEYYTVDQNSAFSDSIQITESYFSDLVGHASLLWFAFCTVVVVAVMVCGRYSRSPTIPTCVADGWDRCIASCYQLVHKPDRSASWIVVRQWTLFIPKPYEVKLSLTAAACSESDRQRDWFQTAAVRDIVWHSWAGNLNKLFCVQSVSECQFHMRSHDSIGLSSWLSTRSSTFSVFSLTHTERGLPLRGCRSIVPALRIIFNRVSILPHFEHLLWACLTDTWTERTYV